MTMNPNGARAPKETLDLRVPSLFVWGQCTTVPWLYVIFCAEAHAGIQVKAIPEDKMKVMRRMGDLALGRDVQFNRDMRS